MNEVGATSRMNDVRPSGRLAVLHLGHSLDRQYLKKWIRELSLTMEWIAVGKLFEDPNR